MTEWHTTVRTPMQNDFERAYRALEQRMRTLAESDGDVYLPNPEPTGPVDYVLICMEPSLGHWAQSAHHARQKVLSGFRNFLAGMEPMLLHFAVRSYLCESGKRYHITDFSKGAMLVTHASRNRTVRYDRWYALLQKEIDLVATPDARIIAVGKTVAEQLRRHKFRRNVSQVLHYSPLASRARNTRLEGHEHGFAKFARSLSLEDVLKTALKVLDEARLPPAIYKEARSIVRESQLSESRKKLVYTYKLDFEALKTCPR